MTLENFWSGKKVFITGHTGFKGSWLVMWLLKRGAIVKGYSLNPPTNPSLFELCGLHEKCESIIGDIRDLNKLTEEMKSFNPDLAIHMAAQSLVVPSYEDPIGTFSTNVMGTLNFLEASRKCSELRAIVNVTTDKCYENKEWIWPYRECDPLGGKDPYSNSKACAELVSSSYRNSFFKDEGKILGTVRAGNVIGGGDWADCRLIPDCVKGMFAAEDIKIRNPKAIRPWQHVLEPLNGYMILAEKLYLNGNNYEGAWNFSSEFFDAKEVGWIVKRMKEEWGSEVNILFGEAKVHEAQFLQLDSSKAKVFLGWKPTWNIESTIIKVCEWYKAFYEGENMHAFSLKQIEEFEKAFSLENI